MNLQTKGDSQSSLSNLVLIVYVYTFFIHFNSDFCWLLITFTSSLDLDQDSVGTDPDPIRFTQCSRKNLLKKVNFKKGSDNKNIKSTNVQRVKRARETNQ